MNRDTARFPPGVIVQIKSDYDGYFEDWIRQALWDKYESHHSLRHAIFHVTAGGHRGHDVAWNEDEGTQTLLKIDFYSGARRVGGPELCDELFDAL